MNYIDDNLFLVIPNSSHETEYCRIMDRWEALETNIQPELMRRYSKKLGANVSFTKWLEWCEDDRTTGSMLETGIPCTLYFLTNFNNDILGSIVINHNNTHRGHLHAGIVPWFRGKGYGTIMLKLALSHCLEMGIQQVQIVPRKNNINAIQTILHNGGVLLEEFCEDGEWSLRYEIDIIQFDYTEWRRDNLFNNMSVEELSKAAMKYRKAKKENAGV
jgi:predicted acetyltransferase